jgi:hypothetical protein
MILFNFAPCNAMPSLFVFMLAIKRVCPKLWKPLEQIQGNSLVPNNNNNHNKQPFIHLIRYVRRASWHEFSSAYAKRKKNWPEMKCQALTSQMIWVGPWISFLCIGNTTTWSEPSGWGSKGHLPTGWQNGLSGRKDISQIVGIMDLVDDKLSNEHFFFDKSKVHTTPLFTSFLGPT